MAGRRQELSAAAQQLARTVPQQSLQVPLPERTPMSPVVRAKLDEFMRALRQRSAHPFEVWCNSISQHSIDIMLTTSGREAMEPLFERFRRAGVIDANDKLVPKEDRARYASAYEAQRKAERERIEAELAAHGVIPREPGADDE
jgi:hypothetical protein